MSKLTYEDLKKLGAEKKKAFSRQHREARKPTVYVGMGSCGIAAGAKETFDVIKEQIEKSGIEAEVKAAGCMGLCYSEPTVEVVMPDMPTIVYGNVDEETGKKIIRKHVIHKQIINDHIFAKPAQDIIDQG